MRRLTISKICALWIAALILMPFTAPFKTFDLPTSENAGAHDALPKDKVDADDKITAPSIGSLLPPSFMMVVVRAVARQDQTEEPLVRHAILRL